MRHRRLLTILIILNLLFIWGNSLLSRDVSGDISDRVMEVMNLAAEKLGLGKDFFTILLDLDGDGIPERSSRLVRKMAHLTEFACLGALLVLRLEDRGRRVMKAFAFCVATAVSDELLQILSHRGSQIRDVLLDSIGAVIGIAISAALAGHRNGRTEQ